MPEKSVERFIFWFVSFFVVSSLPYICTIIFFWRRDDDFVNSAFSSVLPMKIEFYFDRF